jgi:radical SAM superfamily enzyme YgiQ (UPF0313 family)
MNLENIPAPYSLTARFHVIKIAALARAYKFYTTICCVAKVLLSPIYGNPPSFDYLIPNAGTAMLAASLRKSGHEARIYDPNLPGNNLHGIETAVEAYQPDLLGLSIYHNGLSDTMETAEKIKETHPKLKIVGGGPQVTTWEEDIYRNNKAKAFDAFGLGECEETIVELANWADGGAIEAVPGVMYLDNGTPRKNPIRPITDLDSLPAPAWDLFELDRYLPILPLQLGRGCPWSKCAFCSHGKLSGKRRERSARISADELERDVREFGITNFRTTDSSPTHGTLDEFSEEIISRGLKQKYDIKWCTLVRASEVDQPLLEKMGKAGCVSVFIGAESGDDQMLGLMSKGESMMNNFNAIKAAKAAGVKVAVSTIIGFPGETEESIQRTVDFVRESSPDSAMFYPLGVLPNTPLADAPEKYGIRLHKDWKDKYLLAKIELVGGRPKMPHYFDYEDGKSNLDYDARVGKLLQDNAPALARQGMLIQMPEHVFLFAEMLDKEQATQFLDNSVPGPYEQKLVEAFHQRMKADPAGLDRMMELMWDNSRARAANKQ